MELSVHYKFLPKLPSVEHLPDQPVTKIFEPNTLFSHFTRMVGFIEAVKEVVMKAELQSHD